MKAGWQMKKLGEVCVVEKNQGIHKNLPYVGLEHIESQTGRFIGSTEQSDVKSSTFKFSPAHLLYGRLRPYLNKVMLPSFTGHCSTEIFPLKPHPGVSREFMQYWFLRDATVDQIDATSTGARMPRANMNAVVEFLFPIPPLPEQQRIVRILDEAFEGIAAAKANTEKNLQNARAIFESHLQSVFSQRGEGWVEKRLGNLASFRNGINYTKDSKGEQVKIVGVRNFQNNFRAPLDDLDTVTIDGELSELDSLRQDDVLAVRSNGNIALIGRCILVGEVTEKMSHSGFTIRIRLSNGEVIPRYFCHFMKAGSSRKRLTDGGTGTNIKSLNQGMLSELEIPFPPVSMQKVLVEKLESLSAEIQCLESIYQHKLSALEELKKSLLHQAFSGQL